MSINAIFVKSVGGFGGWSTKSSVGCKTPIMDNFGQNRFLQILNHSIRAHIHVGLNFWAILIHCMKLIETGSVCVACKTPSCQIREY